MTNNSVATTAVVGLLVVLSACGSGSGADTSVDSTAPPSLTSATLPSPLPDESENTTPTDSTIAPATTSSQPSNPLPDVSGIVEGIVIAVEGTLGQVESFTLRLPTGSDVTFLPEEGVLFDGSAPIDHVRDHMTSGAPVRVEYTTLSDGTLSALQVGDA